MKKAIKKADKIKDIKKKYEFIYDYMCEYLDNETKTKNMCKFEQNTCIKERKCKRFKENGCCNTVLEKGTCHYLKNNKCSIKSISCKLFTCKYLKQKGIKYNSKDFLILKKNFNIRQRFHLDYDIIKDKEYMIKILLKYKGIKMLRLF